MLKVYYVMKKNYLQVFQKAEDLIKKVALIMLVFSCTIVNAYAQHDNLMDFISFPKGPADAMSESLTLDASPPVITYTPLTGTCATTNRVLTATITDADGIPSGTALPKLYWEINNNGTFFPVTAVSIGSNQYTFTFGAAGAGSIVSYYIVAQDNAGNVIAKPNAGAGGYTINPPAAAIRPTNPDFYVIQSTLAAGTYTVGATGAQNYLTITDAVNAYNNSCLGGPIVFILMDAVYDASEVFPITINNPLASSTNTLIIKPNTAVNTTIQGSALEAIFKLNGSDYVTIDGSNNGTTTRNLTIQNNSAGLSSNVIWVGSASVSNGATRNSIKNCIITGSGTNATYAGIISSSGVAPGNVAETANSDNLYTNNSINTCYQGIVLIGPAGGESNNIISSNTIGSTQSSKKLGYRAAVVSNQTNVTVNNNAVQGVVSSLGVGSDTDPAGGIIVSGVISGGNIYSNIIEDIKNTSVAGWQAYGINLQSTSPAAGLKIYNNFLFNITGNGNSATAANNGIGISVQSGGGYGIYFNSVNLYVNQVGASGGISACLIIGTGVTATGAVDIRNNIFSNRRTTGLNYAIYSSQPNIIFSNINYNDYYATGFVGYLGSNRANIAAWQSATGLDGNSVATNPIYVSNSDLHLQLISPLNDQGITIAGITTDIDAVVRNPNPDIGADEFTPPVCSGNTGGTAISDFITICSSGSISLSASGFSYGLGIAYQWESSTDNFGTAGVVIPGETNPTSANPPVISVTTWYRLRVRCASGAFGYSNAIMITVYNPAISSTTPGSRCGPGTVNLSATGSPTTAMQWYTTLNGGAPVYSGSPFTTPSLTSSTTYYVESTYLGSSGTVGPVSPAVQGGTISTQITSWEVTFNVTQATKLLTVDIYPMASGENSVIEVFNSSGVLIQSTPYVTNVSGGATPQTISLNVSLPIGNGYYLYATPTASVPTGIPASGLKRNISGASYPYGAPGSTDIQIIGNGFDATFYMCYYRWRFSNGCSSTPRTPVIATVVGSTTLNVTATPPAICAGSNAVLGVTSSNAAFVYTWTPGPLTGPNQTVSPAATTTYTVNATDGTCTATGNVTITVNPASSNVTISPATVTKCSNSAAQLLTASGGDIADVNIINENFNGASTPAGWVIGTAGTTGTVASKTWQPRPDLYVNFGNTFRSNDSSQFYLTSSRNLAGVTKTTLQTPSFSLAGYTASSLYFYHFYSEYNATDSAVVEYATSAAGPWTRIRRFLSRGQSNAFRKDTINLTAYAGVATNFIRFRYYSPTDGFYWAIDNVSVTGGNSGGSPITWLPAAGLFTDAAATVPYTAGTITNTVYAKPLTTTTYTATATPVNACQKSQTIDVTVRPITATLTASPGSVCPTGASTISVALTGTGPWNLTYTDGVTPVTVNAIASSPYTFIVNPPATTTWSVTALSDIYCTATAGELTSSNITVTVTPSAYSTWLGNSTDWFDPANWCGGIPTATKDVVISTTPFYPVITLATAVARDITISGGAFLTINTAARLSFKGVFVNNGTIVNNGAIVLNGSVPQSFPGGTTGTITTMNDLEVNNPAGATVNKAITIRGTLKPTAGNITLNNVIVTLRSDAAGTARVDVLGGTAGFLYTGAGKFSVERYISSSTRKAWRFLSAPIGGAQTISQAWQEGEIAPTYTANNYGTQIVGPGGTANGFDMANAITSLKTYNSATNGWTTVPNTNATPISTTGGYFIFVRGDRGSNTFASPLSATTLRTAGPIKTGPVGPSSTATASGFLAVGNPYPSAIDFTSTTRNGLQNTYYLWDPKLGTYGGYQTFTGPTYTATPGGAGSSYSSGNKYIESGQAFFVVATAAAVPHNISFAENNKVSGSYQVARNGVMARQLRTQLSVLSGTDVNLIDGTLIEFDAAYSNGLDDLDAPKLSNFGENIGILKAGKAVSVERHAEIVGTDTVFYQLGQLKQQVYQLEIIAENLSTAGLGAYLEDNYLHTGTEVALNANTIVNFTVTADAGSKASDRFRLVFSQLGPVPVTFTIVRAERQDKKVLVSWKVENELNIDHYAIERSANGRNFSELGVKAAVGNGGGATAQYNWMDVLPLTGDNFYRVKSIGTGNDTKYSGIVKVYMNADASMITVYPNPVKDGMIGLYFENVLKGGYNIKLFAANGQLILSKRINFPGGTQRIQLPAGADRSKGLYTLDIILPKGGKRVYKILFE